MPFDPYLNWLEIPREQRPPNHYQLLGVSDTEANPDVIRASYRRRYAHVRNYELSEQGDEATRILGELSQAVSCLTDETTKQEYDRQLRGLDTVNGEPAEDATIIDIAPEADEAEPFEVSDADVISPLAPDPAGKSPPPLPPGAVKSEESPVAPQPAGGPQAPLRVPPRVAPPRIPPPRVPPPRVPPRVAESVNVGPVIAGSVVAESELGAAADAVPQVSPGPPQWTTGKPKKVQDVWAIDIGQCALKALHARRDEEGRLEVLGVDYIEHPQILSRPDVVPEQLIAEAMAKFVQRNSLRGDNVVLAVPGQLALMRYLQLPPIEPRQLRRRRPV